MQLPPPSSCVSPIPFPLCALLEGTHGTAPQGATRRDWRKAQQSLFRRYAPYGMRIDKYRAFIMPLRFVRQA